MIKNITVGNIDKDWQFGLIFIPVKIEGKEKTSNYSIEKVCCFPLPKTDKENRSPVTPEAMEEFIDKAVESVYREYIALFEKKDSSLLDLEDLEAPRKDKPTQGSPTGAEEVGSENRPADSEEEEEVITDPEPSKPIPTKEEKPKKERKPRKKKEEKEPEIGSKEKPIEGERYVAGDPRMKKECAKIFEKLCGSKSELKKPYISKAAQAAKNRMLDEETVFFIDGTLNEKVEILITEEYNKAKEGS